MDSSRGSCSGSSSGLGLGRSGLGIGLELADQVKVRVKVRVTVKVRPVQLLHTSVVRIFPSYHATQITVRIMAGDRKRLN